MKFLLSKRVRHGSICAFHGNKIVRASRRTKNIVGVWEFATQKTTMDLEGNTTTINSPCGLVIKGSTNITCYIPD